jgi:hypothetical protein
MGGYGGRKFLKEFLKKGRTIAILKFCGKLEASLKREKLIPCSSLNERGV